MFGACCRCIEDVKWLNKMDINGQTDQRGHTPLHMCAANGHVEMMQVRYFPKPSTLDPRPETRNRTCLGDVGHDSALYSAGN